MVEWLAGNRIRGTSTERTTTTGFNTVAGVAGGWKEIGRTTLGTALDDIVVSSLADKRYLMVLTYTGNGSGNINTQMRLNSDTGSNYSYRASDDGAADFTGAPKTLMASGVGGSASSVPIFDVGYLSNVATKEKLWVQHGVGQRTAGAGTAPNRRESVGKHAQTTNPISAVTQHNGEGGDFTAGAECVVLGWDPADTHTTNFWEELASVDITSGSQMTANFTAKKYLWIQFYYEASTTSSELFFNNDQGNNYARRYSNNGGSDATTANIPAITNNFGFDTNPHYGSMFVINNASNEKLVIAHLGMQMGAGAGNAPQRTELVSKWANTSAQISRFDIKNTGSFSRGICKVWGSD
jgi:hypothetical protein